MSDKPPQCGQSLSSVPGLILIARQCHEPADKPYLSVSMIVSIH